MPPKPPAKPITNLSQIDISKMDIKELQNIDYEKLIAGVRKKPDIAISIACVLVTFVFCFNQFTKSQSEARSFSNKILEMKEKVKILDEYLASQNDLKKFLNSLPAKITENEFINTVTDFATKYNVQIESLSPSQNRTNPIYDSTIVSLTASSQSFNDVGQFIEAIENSKLNIRVNRWTASMGAAQGGSRSSRNSSDPNELWVNFQIDIELVTFKQ